MKGFIKWKSGGCCLLQCLADSHKMIAKACL